MDAPGITVNHEPSSHIIPHCRRSVEACISTSSGRGFMWLRGVTQLYCTMFTVSRFAFIRKQLHRALFYTVGKPYPLLHCFEIAIAFVMAVLTLNSCLVCSCLSLCRLKRVIPVMYGRYASSAAIWHPWECLHDGRAHWESAQRVMPACLQDICKLSPTSIIWNLFARLVRTRPSADLRSIVQRWYRGRVPRAYI